MIDFVRYGWQNVQDPELKPYKERREELSVLNDCPLWGNRVFIPPAVCERALDLFHEGHPGASHMKSLSRSYIWWPGLDSDIDSRVKSCH